MPGGLPDCLTAPRPGSLALTPLQLVLLLSSALPLRFRYLPRNIRLPRTTRNLSRLRAPFHPFGYRFGPAILLPRPILSPTFVSSFSSPLASTVSSFSLYFSLSLSLSPRYTISHACICHLVPDTPRLAGPSRLSRSLSLSPRSTPTYRYGSTLSVPFPRCRDLSRLFLSFPYESCSKQSPVRLCSVSWTHLSSSTPTCRPTPLQRRPRRPSYVHTPILALSLGRARTHARRMHSHHAPLSFLFPISPRGSYTIF